MLAKLKQTQFLKVNNLKTKHFYFCVFCFLYLISSTLTFAQIDSLDQLLPTLPANEEKVDVLNELSYLSHRKDVNKTFSYANEALELAKQLGYTKGSAYAIHYLSIANSISGDNALCKELNNSAINLADSLKEYTLLTGAYNVKAFLLKKEGKPEAAVKAYQLALDIATRENDKKSVSNINLNIGEFHNRNGELEKARDYFQSGIKFAEESGNLHNVAWGYSMMASTFRKEKKYKEASTYLKKSIKKAEALNNIRVVSYAKSRLAKVYLETGKIKSAQEQSLEAIALIKKVSDKEVLAEEYIHLMSIYLKGNQPHNAINIGNKGIKLTNEIKSIQKKLSIQELLVSSYAAVENYQVAYEINNLTQKIKDSLDLSTKKIWQQN